jgi:DNA-binding helix-hairpin-helix protein with protein kinase domain
MSRLSVGSRVELPQTRRVANVRRFLGEGSQGAVFDAVVESTGEHFALKWYFPSQGNLRQRTAIDELIERGAPDDRFLWPTEIALIPGDASFGYLMPLRDDTSVGLSDLLTGKVDLPFSKVCTLGMELSDTFLALHNQGLCYRDISFGNVFFEPRTGRPLICDNDNVGVDGASPSAVLGTRRFMAPEIVRREASPSTATDLYSLAVLLFYLLMVGHPLVGRRELEFAVWDEDAESVLFGRDPRFVFDPSDASNAPDPELHGSVVDNWQLYPEPIRRLFTQAFTVGLTDPINGRVRESIWRAALSRVRDVVVRCPACSKESFWRAGVTDARCWSCDRTLADPVRLVVDGRPLTLNRDTVVYKHHLSLDYDFATVIGQVVRHPTRPNQWGLRNESSETWQVVLPDDETVTAEPGRSVGLLPGTRIRIGRTSATIVC